MKGLTYVGRKRYPATAISTLSAVYDSKDRASRNYKNIKKALSDRTTLKLKIPAWKMKIVDNPELMGTKTPEEFYPIVKKRLSTSIGESTENYKEKPDNIVSRLGYGTASKVMHHTLGREGTHVIEGDLSPEYIKKSKHYKRADKEEVKDFLSAGRIGTDIPYGDGCKYMPDNKDKSYHISRVAYFVQHPKEITRYVKQENMTHIPNINQLKQTQKCHRL